MLFYLLCVVFCGAILAVGPTELLWRWAGLAALAAIVWRGRQLYRQSRTDDLTGLNNRRLLEDLERRYRRCPRIGVWYFDLDHLKQVNDSAGHAAGDSLLREFAQVLSGLSGPRAAAFRIGGDEFLLIVPDPEDDAPPLPCFSGISVSVGFASGSGDRLRELIVLAEQQMYRSRRAEDF